MKELSSVVGVVIARFQTLHLEDGQKALLQSLQSKHDQLLLILGSTLVRGSVINPFDFDRRENMVRKQFPELTIRLLEDHPLDSVWSSRLDALITETFPHRAFLLYGSSDRFTPYYSGLFDTIAFPPHHDNAATEVDKRLKDHVNDEVFQAGMFYGYAQPYPKVHPTVDIAVFRKGRAELLLGMKTIDNAWRLPGGFSDPTDESFEAAALRELKEECGDVSVSSLRYETSFRVNDWRYRFERDKIITTLFSCDFVSGDVAGNDDIAEVQWFEMNAVRRMAMDGRIAKEHAPHFEWLFRKY